MLNRPALGLIVGAGLGALDGLSALLSSPEVAGQIGGIVAGSTVKGLLAGVITGAIARRFQAPRAGILVGLLVAAVITFPIAYLNATSAGRPDYYWKIMLPGALVGAIVGFVIVRHGRAAAPREKSA
jgi:hypothetical protein